MNKLNLLGAVLVSGLVLGGCAESMSSGAYTRGQAREVQEVRMGVVESVRQVKIEGTKTPVGTAAGAVVGGIAGSNIGGGKGSTVGAILGAVGGGLAGAAIEEGVTRKPGLEITVKLEGGRMIAITQEMEPGDDFRVGDKVRVLTGGGVTRVSR